jgi:hypothetical protein
VITRFSPEKIAANVVIHPNPNNGLVSILGLTGDGTISINDLSGKIVQKSNFHETYSQIKQLDMTNLPNGLYTITIRSDIGCQTVHKLELVR